MTNAALYLRISKDRTGEGLGVDRQGEDCRELAERLGWHVTETYVDNDVSAMSKKPRPAYQRMLKDIQLGKTEAIIAWHPDRLYRKVSDLGDLVEICKAHDVAISTVRAGHVDLSTASGRLVAGMLAQVAMYEGEHKAERWVRAWRQGREAGEPAKTGSRLFGYTHEGEIIPDEAEVAMRMAKDIASGISILRVTRDLERAGVKTTRGGVWRTGTVRQYLSNPRIAGYSVLGRDEPTGKLDRDGKPKVRRVFDIVAEGKWEPIVDRDTWETVRALFKARTREERSPRVATLGGLIFCGKCGARLITGKARRGRIYRCRSGRPGMEGCGGVSAYAEPVEEVAETFARARLDDPSVWKRIAELQAKTDAPALLAEIQALETRLIELEQQLEQPGVPLATLMRAMERARERLADCQSRLGRAADVTIPETYVGGEEWPEDLHGKRKLIALALGEERLFLDPWDNTGPRKFDPNRVRVAPPPSVP